MSWTGPVSAQRSSSPPIRRASARITPSTEIRWRSVVSFSVFSRASAIAASRSMGLLLVELVRNAREDDAWLVEQQPLDEQRALVMEKEVPGPADDELRHDDRRDRVLPGRHAPDLPEHRAREIPEGSLDDVERNRHPTARPPLLHGVRRDGVEVDVYSAR